MNRADLDKQIANAETRAAIAWRNGDDEQGNEWRERAVELMDLRDRLDYWQARGQRVADRVRCAPVSFYARPAS